MAIQLTRLARSVVSATVVAVAFCVAGGEQARSAQKAVRSDAYARYCKPKPFVPKAAHRRGKEAVLAFGQMNCSRPVFFTVTTEFVFRMSDHSKRVVPHEGGGPFRVKKGEVGDIPTRKFAKTTCTQVFGSFLQGELPQKLAFRLVLRHNPKSSSADINTLKELKALKRKTSAYIPVRDLCPSLV